MKIAFLIAVLVAGCTGLEPGGTVSIAPGDVWEVNLTFDQPTNLTWNWTSSADVSFNVHTHEGGRVAYLTQQTGSEASGFVEVPPGSYSLMWMNTQSETVVLTADYVAKGMPHSPTAPGHGTRSLVSLGAG